MMKCMRSFGLCLAIVAGLTACARNDEGDLRATMNQWFFLGDLEYFKSKTRCTAAVYRLRVVETRRALPVQGNVADAKAAFSTVGVSAFQIEGFSANDLTDALLLKGRGTMGKQVLAAAAQAVPCFEGTSAETKLRKALTRKGGVLVYDTGSEGAMVLDPVARLVFYVAGDVW